MRFASWFRRPAARPARAAHRPTFRPRLEALEARWLPSTLTVTSASSFGRGSLRAEIAAAHSGDTIVFNLKKMKSHTINLGTSGELFIPQNLNLTIQGPAAGQLPVTISGDDIARVFEVAEGATLTLSGLEITGGIAQDVVSNFGEIGGGIFNQGTLYASNCVIDSNGAELAGGGLYNLGVATLGDCDVSYNRAQSSATIDPLNAFGGGIYNAGMLTVNGGDVSSNTATGDGGGIDNEGIANVSGCTVSGNVAGIDGGGIFNGNVGAELTVSGCTVSGNTATSSSTATHGGGIFNGGTSADLTVSGTIFSGNIPDNIYGLYTDGGGNTFE